MNSKIPNSTSSTNSTDFSRSQDPLWECNRIFRVFGGY